MTEIFLGGRPTGAAHPPYVIAELSANHLGKLDRALDLIEIAAKAGASAVKIQTYRADTITIDHDGPEFQISGGLWDRRRLYELYEEAHTPWEWHGELFAKAKSCGVTMFSSPFDPTAVEFLEKLGAPAYKIASFEIVDIPLIELCASTGKPLIVSTGMATRGEIDDAVNAALRSGSGGLALLHCTSGYPTPFSDANLRTIPNLGETYGIPVGLSDHTAGISSAVAAIALGAAIIEKHFTFLRSEGGPDAAFSLEPAELEELCRSCQNAWEALGAVRKTRAESEEQYVKYRRSLYVVKDMASGEPFTAGNVRSIRPGLGLAPKFLPEVMGRRARRALARGTPLSWLDIG